MTETPLPVDLGDGLRLRSATAHDADALADFNAVVHGTSAAEPDQMVANWTRDLLTRPHPTFRPDLFTIVDEPDGGRIVSTLNLIPQTWSFDGIELGVGRIELVGTLPEFRRRGLVRRQMDVAHAWSAAMGHLMQGITGIPWYYRRFGYEMALDLDGPWRLPAVDVPAAKEGESERYRLRPATAADAPFLARTDASGRRRSLVSCVRDEALWQYEIAGRSPQTAESPVVAIIEPADTAPDSSGEALGFVVHSATLWSGALWCSACELAPERSWLEFGPSLLRALRRVGDDLAAAASVAEDRPARVDALGLNLGADHPLYRVAGRGERRPPYAWYVRVPDLAAFVRRVSSALEARVAASAAAGFTGELTLGFYGDGLRLTFADGKLVDATTAPDADWQKVPSFPPLTFLHLLFGHRALADLEFAYPDCRVRDPLDRVLIEALFPRRSSSVWPVS